MPSPSPNPGHSASSLGPTSLSVVRFESIDSTSLHAARLIASGQAPCHPTAYIAHQQTGGIGRHGRPWHSPAGGLYLTLLLPAPAPPPPLLALAIGFTCAEVVDRLLGTASCGPPQALIRWPNDIMLASRKVAGILMESRQDATRQRFTLIGIGLNTNTSANDLHSTPTATSLRSITGTPVDPTAAEITLLAALHTAANTPPEHLAALLPRIRARQFGLGAPHTITLPDGRRTEAVIRGIADSGALLAELESRVHEVQSAAALDAP
ncbi:MAG: biotin--[acetyl-CoA-carboxylase] ligase [Phycisphaerales bacterium]